MFLYDLLNLLNLRHECQHHKVAVNMRQSYCPDCGKLVQNEWYITRCSCCGLKRRAVLKYGKIQPQDFYCSNCGEHEFVIEKIENINFIDVHYAALLRKVVVEKQDETIRCWQEKSIEQPKLLVQY